MNEMNAARKGLIDAEANLAYLLVLFGDTLAANEKYKSGLNGLDAVRYYLMQKHHWLPRDLNSMSHEDLRFALHEDMSGLRLPADAL